MEAFRNEIKQTYENGKKMIESGELLPARALIDKMEKDSKEIQRLYRYHHGDTYIAELKSMLNWSCRKLLEAGDKDYAAGKCKVAIKQYTYVATKMGDLPAAEDAARRLQAVKDYPAGKAALRELEADDKYATVAAMIEPERKIIMGAQEKPDSDQQNQPAASQPSDIEVVVKMTMPKKVTILGFLRELKSEYGDTEAGKKATKLLTQLQADKELIKAIEQWQKQEKARQLFEKARTYERNKMFDKATGFYEELVKDHPDSEYAEKAKARLAQLKKSTN